MEPNIQTPQQEPVQNTQPAEGLVSKFEQDPAQVTLNTGNKVLAFASMLTSFANLIKKFLPKK